MTELLSLDLSRLHSCLIYIIAMTHNRAMSQKKKKWTSLHPRIVSFTSGPTIINRASFALDYHVHSHEFFARLKKPDAENITR